MAKLDAPQESAPSAPKSAPAVDPLDLKANDIIQKYGNNGVIDHQGLKKYL